MLRAHPTVAGSEPPYRLERTRNLGASPGPLWGDAQQLIDRLADDRRVGRLPSAGCPADRGDLPLSELDLFPLHTTMMAYPDRGSVPACLPDFVLRHCFGMDSLRSQVR